MSSITNGTKMEKKKNRSGRVSNSNGRMENLNDRKKTEYQVLRQAIERQETVNVMKEIIPEAELQKTQRRNGRILFRRLLVCWSVL